MKGTLKLQTDKFGTAMNFQRLLFMELNSLSSNLMIYLSLTVIDHWSPTTNFCGRW